MLQRWKPRLPMKAFLEDHTVVLREETRALVLKMQQDGWGWGSIYEKKGQLDWHQCTDQAISGLSHKTVQHLGLCRQVSLHVFSPEALIFQGLA